MAKSERRHTRRIAPIAKEVWQTARSASQSTSTSDESPRWLAHMLGNDPLLAEALRLARKRWRNLPGVIGFGVGRRFVARRGTYAPLRSGAPLFCIKVFVQHKRKRLLRAERLPRYFLVADPQRRKRRRIEVDVVAGSISGAALQTGRPWPSVGVLQPGCTFVYGRRPADLLATEMQAKDAEVGTVGAIFKRDDTIFALSAGHVFCRVCDGDTARPKGVRAVGAQGRSWERVPEQHFFPEDLSLHGGILDAILVTAPPELSSVSSSSTWPDGFLRELAKSEDIKAALASDRAEGFVWVERPGKSRPWMLPVDLLDAAEEIVHKLQCKQKLRPVRFVRSWRYRFLGPPGSEKDPDHTTIGGDSGAPVFIRAADGSGWRLLGVHYLYDMTDDGPRAFATDAATFVQSILGGGLGTKFDFA